MSAVLTAFTSQASAAVFSVFQKLEPSWFLHMPGSSEQNKTTFQPRTVSLLEQRSLEMDDGSARHLPPLERKSRLQKQDFARWWRKKILHIKKISQNCRAQFFVTRVAKKNDQKFPQIPIIGICLIANVRKKSISFNYHLHIPKMTPLPAFDFALTNQGGRSCTGARVAPAKKFGLGRKF